MPLLRKKKMRLKLLAAASLGFSLVAAAPAPPRPVPVFSADRFRAHVTFLADDRLEGRDTGSRGHEIAAAYVASQFLGLGLPPGGENGGRDQRVPFRSASLAGPVSLAIVGAGGSRSFENGV